jgi:hypothetical protein
MYSSTDRKVRCVSLLYNLRAINGMHSSDAINVNASYKLPLVCACFNSAQISTRHTLCWQRSKLCLLVLARSADAHY